MVSVAGMVRAENVRRVELISSLLAELLTASGQQVLVEVPQFELIIDLLFQVISRYGHSYLQCPLIYMSKRKRKGSVFI